MLSLALFLSIAGLASSSLYFGGGHSPILGPNRRITHVQQHGDHLDAHVHTDVVDHHGNVHTIHQDIPIHSTIPRPYYRRPFFNRPYYNSFNNYNNLYRPLYNNFRRPYMTTNTRLHNHDHHDHHHHQFGTDSTSSNTTGTKDPKDQTKPKADSMDPGINSLEKKSSQDPGFTGKAVRTVVLQPAEFNIQPVDSFGHPPDSVTPLKPVADFVSPTKVTVEPSPNSITFSQQRTSLNAQITGRKKPLSGENIQITAAEMQISGSNFPLRTVVTGDMQMHNGLMSDVGSMKRNRQNKRMGGRRGNSRTDKPKAQSQRGGRTRSTNMQVGDRNQPIRYTKRDRGRGFRSRGVSESRFGNRSNQGRRLRAGMGNDPRFTLRRNRGESIRRMTTRTKQRTFSSGKRRNYGGSRQNMRWIGSSRLNSGNLGRVSDLWRFNQRILPVTHYGFLPCLVHSLEVKGAITWFA